mgnify:CR=1 FL=1
MKLYKLIFFFILLFFASCKDTATPIKITPNNFHASVDKVVEVMVHDIFSPPVASRIFAYPNIAAYEIIAQKDSTYTSLAGQISHLKSIPKPDESKQINFSLAALIAHIDLSKQLIFSEDEIEIYRDSLYKYIPVKVVSSSVSKSNNYIVVNKGSKHGIHKEMGVVSTTGISGIVVGVSLNYSTIMSMLNPKMRISARIKNSGQLVNVIWDNSDYLYGTVIDIPSHIKLNKGDSIVTSGNSLIFPEGIMVGEIESHETNDNKNLSTAQLLFSTDFNSAQHLFVIENIMKPEQDSLLNLIDTGDE